MRFYPSLASALKAMDQDFYLVPTVGQARAVTVASILADRLAASETGEEVFPANHDGRVIPPDSGWHVDTDGGIFFVRFSTPGHGTWDKRYHAGTRWEVLAAKLVSFARRHAL